MSVTNTHKGYDKAKNKWRRCRDVIDGRDAILAQLQINKRVTGTALEGEYNPETYLPKLSNQTPDEYLAYCERAAFFNATGRTLDALTGLIFSKDPVAKLPGALDAYADDITLTGTNLREFSEQVVEQQLAVGRVGILTDYPSANTSGLNILDLERSNIRPFLRWYRAENIINWRTTSVQGREVLTMVVLREQHSQEKDEFTTEQVSRYRVLTMTAEGYRVRVMNEKGEVLSDTIPRMRGKALNFIPFTILGANSCSTDVQKPPLIDLVDANINHYRNSADYEHGLHFTGLPTPYVSGVQLDAGQKLAIGSTSAWVFPDPNAKAGFLEFTGEGLKTLKDALKDKEQWMAVLGARMLADDKRAQEAQGTLELRTAGERSSLTSVARAASDGIRRNLGWVAEWAGIRGAAEFALNTNYAAHSIQPQMLTAMVAAYQTGAIPRSVLFENLQKGELVNPDMEFETFSAQLEDEGPDLGTPTGGNDGPDDGEPEE